MDKHKRTLFAIARDGYRFITPALLLTLGTLAFYFAHPESGWLRLGSVASVLLTGWLAYFFRDPPRKAPGIDGGIVSPADGKVMEIDIVDHPGFPSGRAKRVSVFLSIFNVHVNRAPVEGRVGSIDYTAGKFINAMKAKASEENEHNVVEFVNGSCRVYVKQIAGLIARRIVCYLELGQPVRRGERFGLIRFGSRVDTFLPEEAEVIVKKGMHVTGGESVLAVLQNPLKTPKG